MAVTDSSAVDGYASSQLPTWCLCFIDNVMHASLTDKCMLEVCVCVCVVG